MTPIYLFLFHLLTMTAIVNAAPMTPKNTSGWSKEAVLTLAGVCVAILGILVGLVISPRARRWLCSPFTYFSHHRRATERRRHPNTGYQLRDYYEDYIRFLEFMDLRTQTERHRSE
ncbi:hypothetical protein COCSADRAFT_207025 [Bipolaris sorokiniana ND90Pr]|nr:uncharacterized protein COCSADRAFT_207025 [Bipolaris sorokiniana ND90Pr]EMD69167.1 hypothetical protein COCSADRAFT_207025 [Bipolaris sorokiniana ND90Pr]